MWLQPTIERPRWVAFEDDGGLLPVHWVGLNLGARARLGGASLNLVLSVGNGRGKMVDDVRNNTDYQDAKALHGSLELVGIHWPELRAGVSAVFDRIPAQPVDVRPLLPDQPIDELIAGAHVAYGGVPLIVIVESYLVTHTAAGQRWTTMGGFALVGYQIGRVTPYGEVERFASRGGADPFFIHHVAPDAPSFDTLEVIAGVRVDLSDWTALKAEYRQTRYTVTATDVREGVLNWSWGF
jgi:hypothetical protein